MAESDGGSGNWLMTYADFITLMMIFFIVLYTFTPGVEKDKFEAIIGAFQGKDGVLKYDAVFSDEMLDVELQRAKNWDELDKMIQDKSLQEQVQLEMLPAGVRITLGEAVTFATYSATLIADSKVILKEIARAIEQYNYEPLDAVEVFGHTDNRPVINNAGRYPSNWELGASRAISVVKFLMVNADIPSNKFEAATYGKHRPIVSNTTKEGQRKNRRVEVFVKYVQKKSDEEKSILPTPKLTNQPTDSSSHE